MTTGHEESEANFRRTIPVANLRFSPSQLHRTCATRCLIVLQVLWIDLRKKVLPAPPRSAHVASTELLQLRGQPALSVSAQGSNLSLLSSLHSLSVC
jgi:hypothetical protein